MTAPYASADDVRRRVCGTKVGHGRAAEARDHARRLNDDAPGAGFSAYRCPFCTRWHVGHSPSMEALQATARVLRGLDPAPPVPHDPPARPRRRRPKKGSRT